MHETLKLSRLGEHVLSGEHSSFNGISSLAGTPTTSSTTARSPVVYKLVRALINYSYVAIIQTTPAMAAEGVRADVLWNEIGMLAPPVAEHYGEQPDNARHSRLVHGLDLEPGEIDLGLLAGRGLEPHLEGRELKLLSQRTRIPLAGGESEPTSYGCRTLIEEQAVQILQFDCTIFGGSTRVASSQR